MTCSFIAIVLCAVECSEKPDCYLTEHPVSLSAALEVNILDESRRPCIPAGAWEGDDSSRYGESSPHSILAAFLRRSVSLTVLTGAGCSTMSGIPDYRGPDGTWARRRPVQYGDFMRSEAARRHYWARSYAGWSRFASARPNAAHESLAALERDGRLRCLITQNVDRLHFAAGSRRIIELHGDNHTVMCTGCGCRISRGDFQTHLAALNQGWALSEPALAPDGDADVDRQTTASFVVPCCDECGGILKPDVVFFGESVPRERVDAAMNAVDDSDLLLVVGSSLTVWSGYRFALRAAEKKIPVAIINRGETRGDTLAAVKIDEECGAVLQRVARMTSDRWPADE